MKALPKVSFTLSNPIEETNLFYEMCFLSGDFWREHLLKNYPQFKDIKNDEKTKENIKEIVLNIHKNKLEKIDLAIELKKQIWDKVNDAFFNEIFSILKCEFFGDFIISLTILPFGARFIKENKIGVQYWLNGDEFLKICAHEFLHLVWFKKVLEEFPKKDIKNFDNDQTIEWKISEIICPIILNSEKIKTMIGTSKPGYPFDDKVYQKFSEIYNNKANKTFKKFYSELESVLKANK